MIEQTSIEHNLSMNEFHTATKLEITKGWILLNQKCMNMNVCYHNSWEPIWIDSQQKCGEKMN